MPIDRQRGALIRKYGAGGRCIMYYDEPGTYYDENGNELPKETAKRAGFDVANDSKAAARSRVKSRTERQLAVKFAEAEERISQMSADEIQAIGITEHGGIDRYAITDGDGNMVCQILFNYEEAVEFYESVTGLQWVSAADDPPRTDSPFAPVALSLRDYLTELGVEVPEEATTPELVQLADETVTVAKLKKYLAAAEIEFENNARKDDLIALTVAHLSESSDGGKPADGGEGAADFL